MSLINTTAKTVELDDPETLLFSGVDVDDAITQEPTVLNKAEDKPLVGAEAEVTTVEPQINNGAEDQNLIVDEPTNEIRTPGFIDFFKNKIEKGDLFAFDDYDESEPLEDYLKKLSAEDFDELLRANEEARIEEIRKKTPHEFFNALPPEFQYAARYLSEGGTDLKGLFKLLSEDQDTKDLNPESDAKSIARQYLKSTTSYTKDEIEETINDWEDSGKLDKKAKEFKPKLDEFSQARIEQKLADQQAQEKKKQQAAQQYVQTVQSQLVDPVLNGLKITTDKQQELLQGLLSPSYQSLSGKPVNKLGYLLEKYQTVEPNYQLIAEALWLLENPDDYRQKVMQHGKNAATLQTVRALKTEATTKVSSGAQELNTRTTVPRKHSIFKR